MLIIIDPGHGGRDPGATGFGLQEKDLVLKVAKNIVNKLTEYEVEIIPTRDEDKEVSLSARAKMANERQADFFCSLHVNAGGGTGFESYVHFAAPERTEVLRSVIHEEMARYYGRLGFPDRGKKRANFAVLRETAMPAVLLENLFIDHPRDAAYLAAPLFVDGLAGALAAALIKAFELKPKRTWDPAGEIARLKERGLIVDDHDPGAPVTWGEFATVMNRLLDRTKEATTKKGRNGK